MLKLNDDKTELIVFTPKYKQDLYNDLSITFGGTVLDCSQVKDLGVRFDRVLSLRQHMSYTSKTCRFHLRNISRIRKYIPQDISVVLIKSLVMSRQDYTNGLLYGHPKCTVSGLQADIEMEDINLCNDEGDLIGDHNSIECTIQQSAQLHNREIVSYRNVKQIDIDKFCMDVRDLPTLNSIQGTVNELVDRYNLGLRALLDKHAPIIHRVVTVR